MPLPLDIRYAQSGDVSIAYRVMGEGPLDLIFVHGFVGNIEVGAQQPLREAFFERLTRFARVIEFDRRGTGLSDRVREIPTLEARMDDLRAVMDAAGSDRAAVFVDDQYAGHAHEFGGAGRAMLLSPGKHRIKITLPGYQSFETEIEVRANQKYDIKTQLPKGHESAEAPSS